MCANVESGFERECRYIQNLEQPIQALLSLIATQFSQFHGTGSGNSMRVFESGDLRTEQISPYKLAMRGTVPLEPPESEQDRIGVSWRAGRSRGRERLATRRGSLTGSLKPEMSPGLYN